MNHKLFCFVKYPSLFWISILNCEPSYSTSCHSRFLTSLSIYNLHKLISLSWFFSSWHRLFIEVLLLKNDWIELDRLKESDKKNQNHHYYVHVPSPLLFYRSLLNYSSTSLRSLCDQVFHWLPNFTSGSGCWLLSATCCSSKLFWWFNGVYKSHQG